MIYLFSGLVAVELLVILTLMVRTPVRKLVIAGLDQAKQRRGLVIVKTVAATVLLVFISTLHGLTTVQKRLREAGSLNPTDQVLMAAHLLEASLMGMHDPFKSFGRNSPRITSANLKKQELIEGHVFCAQDFRLFWHWLWIGFITT